VRGAVRRDGSVDGKVGSRSLSACSASTTGSFAGSSKPTRTEERGLVPVDVLVCDQLGFERLPLDS
jgi:hypothetical protein